MDTKWTEVFDPFFHKNPYFSCVFLIFGFSVDATDTNFGNTSYRGRILVIRTVLYLITISLTHKGFRNGVRAVHQYFTVLEIR